MRLRPDGGNQRGQTPGERFLPSSLPLAPVPVSRPGPRLLRRSRLVIALAVLIVVGIALPVLGAGFGALAFDLLPSQNTAAPGASSSGLTDLASATQTTTTAPTQPPATVTAIPASPTTTPAPQPTATALPPTATPRQSPAPAMQYFIQKYGFDQPRTVGPISQEEWQRLKQMLPAALIATARYNARFHAHVEPEMLLWWTHAEQIGARINYSNCANEAPPSGSYFVSITNCDRPDFWQLGYGNQFGNIWVLKTAFADLYGNPNDAAFVQRVGQSVLDADRSQHTTPACGGYSCTFPSMTIDQIMADVHYQSGDHAETTSNWWASVLSRDPRINSYMLALALTSFSHAQTQNWVGCYYQEPCWQYESNCLAQILAIWQSLGAS